jgi:hypothetical protein
MMNMNEAFSHLTICVPEVKPANAAGSAVRRNALPAGFWTALVGIDRYASHCALMQWFCVTDLLWQWSMQNANTCRDWMQFLNCFCHELW